MVKGFLSKRVVLLIALVVVLILVVIAMRGNFSGLNSANQRTFFGQFVASGGPIVWFVLFPMSVLMVSLALEHSLNIRRKKLLPETTSEQIIKTIEQFGIAKLESQLTGKDDLVSVAVVQAVSKSGGDWFRMRSVLTESLQDQAAGLLRKIEWLSLIGNVSPMVGLFGTVFGMIKLFDTIVVAGGQPQPAQLAGGISVALVTTFWGLSIAIPALAIYGVFRNRIETLVSDAVIEAENIMPKIRRVLIRQQKQQKPGPAKPLKS